MVREESTQLFPLCLQTKKEHRIDLYKLSDVNYMTFWNALLYFIIVYNDCLYLVQIIKFSAYTFKNDVQLCPVMLNEIGFLFAKEKRFT